MMKRPLSPLALVFSLGIIVASRISIPPVLLYSLLAISLIFSLLTLRERVWFDIFLFCFIFILGAALLKNSQTLPSCHIYNVVYSHVKKNEHTYIVKGYINTQPVANNNKTSFIFKAQEIQWENLNSACCGNILVYLKGKKDLYYGDGLILQGNLYRPFNWKAPSGQGYRDYLYNQDIRLIMNVKTEMDVIGLNKNQGFLLERLALWLGHKIESLLSQRVSRLTASVLSAMILGKKRDIPWVVNNAMMKTGTVHILPRLYTKMPSFAL